jgi:hypothetical protein
MAKRSHLERMTTRARGRRGSTLMARLEYLLAPLAELPFGSAVSPAIPDIGQPLKRRRATKRSRR